MLPKQLQFKKFKKIFIAILAVVTFWGYVDLSISPVYSDDIDDLEDQIDAVEQDKDKQEDILNEIQDLIDEISGSSASIYSKIATLQAEIDDISEELDQRESALETKQADLDLKQEDADKKLDTLKYITSEAYKNARVGLLDVLLSKDNGDDFFRAFSMHRLIARRQGKIIDEVLAEIEEIEKDKLALEAEVKLIKSEKSQLDEGMAALKNEQARIRQELIAQAQLEAAVKAEIASINTQLDGLSQDLKDAINAKVGGGGDNTGGGDYDGGTSPQPPSGDAGTYDIYVGGTKVASNVPGPIRVVHGDDSEVFRVNGSLYYRGILEMREDTNVFLINELPFEMYLYGIAEMPSSWPSEALKTQAVAARTYAVKNWNKRSPYLYNLRDDVFDQNYTGYYKEMSSYGSNWRSAVQGTSSKVLKYGSDIVSTYYHSTCAGHTLASEEVWVSALPYTRAESDWTSSTDSYGDLVAYGSSSYFNKKKWCGSAYQSCTSTDTINDAQMMDLANATIYLDMYPNKENNILPSSLGGYSASELQSALGSNSIQNKVGTLTNVKSIYNNGSTTITSSARKTSYVRIIGANGSYDLPGEEFWTVFNSRAPGSLHIYYSNFWTVQKESGSWNFYTRGYGHRVGMCQYGAYGRAQAGQNYSQILTHYYAGTSLGTYTTSNDFRVGVTRVATGDVYISSYSGTSYVVYSNGNYVDAATGGESLRVVSK